MKNKKKTILVILVVVLLAAIVAGVVAFRAKPVLDPEKDYLLGGKSGDLVMAPTIELWPQGADESYETRETVSITKEQEQAVLEILSRYEKRLSGEKVYWVPVQTLFPVAYASVEAEMPEWLEAQVVVWGDTKELEVFNIVLGDGHAQQREGYTFHPPYYNIENEEQLYEELAEVLALDDLLAEYRE